jgi:hypothetical protein
VAGDRAGAGLVVATTIEVTATDHHVTMSATTVAEGVVPIELVNDGPWPHQVLVARLADGQTKEDYLAAFEGGEVAADELITHAGGVNIVDPGTSGSGYADLAPGTYVVLCFIPGEHGESHLMDGMIEELTVVPDETVAAPQDPSARYPWSTSASPSPREASRGRAPTGSPTTGSRRTRWRSCASTTGWPSVTSPRTSRAASRASRP